jgi:hypothetical protein
VHPVRQLQRRQAGQAGRRQLQRQRDTVQPLADQTDRPQRRVVEFQLRHRRCRPIQEQPRGSEFGYPAGRRQLVRHAQRCDRQLARTRHRQRLAAGRQDPNACAAAQDRLGERGDRLDQVLAVVQQHQQFPGREVSDERILGITRTAGDAHPECVRHRVRQQLPVADRGQPDQPGPAGEPCGGSAGDLNGQ